MRRPEQPYINSTTMVRTKNSSNLNLSRFETQSALIVFTELTPGLRYFRGHPGEGVLCWDVAFKLSANCLVLTVRPFTMNMSILAKLV